MLAISHGSNENDRSQGLLRPKSRSTSARAFVAMVVALAPLVLALVSLFLASAPL